MPQPHRIRRPRLASNLGTLACVAVAAVPVIVAGTSPALTRGGPGARVLVCAAAYASQEPWDRREDRRPRGRGTAADLMQVAIRTKL